MNRPLRNSTRRLLDLARDYPGVPLRRTVAAGGARWVQALPDRVRRRLDLEGEAIRPLRVEIGGGPFPSPGYLHVDADRSSRHLEHVAPAWQLPFPDASVAELLAIHVLEHVHPSQVERTLREWRRVLEPDGFAEIHVPNAATVFAAFLNTTGPRKWDLLIPIFGMTADPASQDSPSAELARHHVIYDFDLLRQALLAAGFDQVSDVSEQVTDRHTEGWAESDLVSRISLVVRAVAGPAR
ncbi:MAG: methyltransferase domain-containing protein [Actinomycetota bacterium]|nr:methyltransferase domain-containing protein [Actinomycetota bacterium]